jgi:hypothetical protein
MSSYSEPRCRIPQNGIYIYIKMPPSADNFPRKRAFKPKSKTGCKTYRYTISPHLTLISLAHPKLANTTLESAESSAMKSNPTAVNVSRVSVNVTSPLLSHFPSRQQPLNQHLQVLARLHLSLNTYLFL